MLTAGEGACGDVPPPPPSTDANASAKSYSPLVKKRALRAMQALEIDDTQKADLYPLLCEHYRMWLDSMAHAGRRGMPPPPRSASGAVPDGGVGEAEGAPPPQDAPNPFEEVLNEIQLQQLHEYFQEEAEKLRPAKGGKRPAGPPPGGGPGGMPPGGM